MAKRNSKRIGGEYERECSHRLSEWLTGNKEELVVWRTSGSGSVGTNRKKKGLSGKGVDGDVQCLDSRFEKFFDTFFIDSKSLGNVHLMMINDKNKKSNQLLSEWRKVSDDALTSNKIPMMLVKARNDRKIADFIVFPSDVVLEYTDCISYDVTLDDKLYQFKVVVADEFYKDNRWELFVESNSCVK